MRPLTVLTGFVMGSCVSIALSLLLVLITFSLLGDEYPRVRHEFGPLTRSLGIFTAMTAISAGSFYTLVKNHPWRLVAQGLLWIGVFLTGWYYWP